MTATRQPVRRGSAPAMSAMQRAARAVRELHDEVVTGTEAVVRGAGVPWKARPGRERKLASARPAPRS
jgi:hypothetical protein